MVSRYVAVERDNMTKLQESFDKLLKEAKYEQGSQNTSSEFKNEDFLRLQKLIDRETPKKYKKTIAFATSDPKAFVPVCPECSKSLLVRHGIDFTRVYRCRNLECEQLIDWSSGEWEKEEQ